MAQVKHRISCAQQAAGLTLERHKHARWNIETVHLLTTALGGVADQMFLENLPPVIARRGFGLHYRFRCVPTYHVSNNPTIKIAIPHARWLSSKNI